jgi:hypothetical protein
MGDEMPADPFRDGMPDWGPLAGNHFSFFAAHLGAGFTEAQALDLTGRYLGFVLTVMFANQPAQQQEQDPGDV